MIQGKRVESVFLALIWKRVDLHWILEKRPLLWGWWATRKMFPREAVAAPSPEELKSSLDEALSNLVWWKLSLVVVPPTAGGWNLMFNFPSNVNHSVILYNVRVIFNIVDKDCMWITQKLNRSPPELPLEWQWLAKGVATTAVYCSSSFIF